MADCFGHDGQSAKVIPGGSHHRHQRQNLDRRAWSRRFAARPAHGPLHLPSPEFSAGAHLDRRPGDLAGRIYQAWEDVAPFVAWVDEVCRRGQAADVFLPEVFTVMAYAAFADAPVDVAVVEVGMGGRWDATNVIDAEGRRTHDRGTRP